MPGCWSPCSCLGWFPPFYVLVAHVDAHVGTFLPPALGMTDFMHPGQRGHRLLLPPITTVPALTPPPPLLPPLFPFPAPRSDGGAGAPQPGLLCPDTGTLCHRVFAEGSSSCQPRAVRAGQRTQRGSPLRGGDLTARVGDPKQHRPWGFALPRGLPPPAEGVRIFVGSELFGGQPSAWCEILRPSSPAAVLGINK